MAGMRGRRTTTLGGAGALRKGASGSVTGGGDGRREGVRWTTTLGEAEALRKGASGGVTGGAERRRDERCRGRRRERGSHGRGREQALPQGRAPGLPEGERRDYRRGRAPVLPEGATVGVTGEGERWCGRRVERSSYGRGERRRYRRGERRRYRRGRAPALPEGATAGTMQPMGENGGKTLVANCAVDFALAVRSEWASPVEVCRSHYSCGPNLLRV